MWKTKFNTDEKAMQEHPLTITVNGSKVQLEHPKYLGTLLSYDLSVKPHIEVEETKRQWLLSGQREGTFLVLSQKIAPLADWQLVVQICQDTVWRRSCRRGSALCSASVFTAVPRRCTKDFFVDPTEH